MTDRQLLNRIEKLDSIADQQKELEAQAEKIRSEIKEDMERKQLHEVCVGNRVIRLKKIVFTRFDGKALSIALPEVYKCFLKCNTCYRFTIS